MSHEPWDDYAYTALIAFCFLIRDGRILLIRRANEPYKGEVTIPGGRKKHGESIADACSREMLEETGYRLGHKRFAGVLHAYRDGDKMEYLSNYFVCRNFRGEMRASDEGELLWVDLDASTRLAGIHPFYLRLLPYVMKDKLPFCLSVHISTGASGDRCQYQE